MQSFDAIIIGGGTNGLAAAGRLAKSGRKLLVLEASSITGGGAQTHEFAPGFKTSSVAHLLNMFDPRVEQGLDLGRHGLAYAATSIATTALSASGDHLVLEGSYGERVLGSFSNSDRASWTALRSKLLRFAALLRPLKDMTPPQLAGGKQNDVMKLARLGLNARMMGRSDLREFMRMILINVADVLNDEIADDRLKGVVAFDTVLGAHMGPRSPNSLLLLYNRLASEAAGATASLALPKGGMGSVPASMFAAVRSLGVEIRTNAKVKSVLIEGDRAAGVILQNGEQIRARSVVSAINPKTAFLDLIGPRHLDTETVRRARNVRMRGNACKLHLALRSAPDFKGANLATRLVIAPSINSVELAFNAAKYGAFSEHPVMEIMLPSAIETGHAPSGQHVVSAIVQFAPYALKQGWKTGRAAFLDRILKTLETYAPGIGALVTHCELLTPVDLEERYGFIGGNWHHGELAAEQMLFVRPMPGVANYETPISGFYLASAGSHPGGGISGAAGWNAAERIIQVEARA